MIRLLLPIILLLFSFSLFSQTPKGDRILAWQVDATENEDYDMAFGFARNACQESTHLSVTWSGLEPEAGTFDAEFIVNRLDIANIYFPLNDTKVEFQFSITNTTTREVPEDLEAVDFSDPLMISRFKTAVDTIFAHIPDIELSAFNIGNETDILFGLDEDQYNDYRIFLDSVVPYVKSAYYDLYETEILVGTTFTLEGLTDPSRAALCKHVNENLDIVSVTYYPLNPDFTMASPEVVEEDFDALVEQYSDTEHLIYFAECGYASSETCNSSEELQAQFYSEVFTVWDKHYDKIKYLTIFKSSDWSSEAVELFGEYYGIDDPIFLEYLRTLGVRTWNGDGTNKLAYEFILCELEARDWCDVDCGLTGIENLTGSSSVQLYPNPSENFVTVKSPEKINTVTLYNSTGSRIIATAETTIDVTQLPNGIYFLTIELNNGQTLRRKFSKI